MTTTRPAIRLVTTCGADLAPDSRRWFQDPDREDLAAVHGLEHPVLDVGCGPGRIVAHLVGAGVPALGVDVSARAVARTRARGAPVLRRSVFDPMPGAGRWGSAVLLDGNVGIGGHPVRLLQRVGDLVRAGGRIVVEVAGPGTDTHDVEACFVVGDRRSEPFPWAIVGVEGIVPIADEAGLRTCWRRRSGSRWFATLRRD